MRMLFLLALLTGGCSNAFEETKKVDTLEAWDQFLAETDPSQSERLFAEDRVEELMTAKAEASGALSDWDAVLKRFPNSRNKKKLTEARVQAALKVAEAENTAEAWKKFADENPTADGALIRSAQNRIAVAAWLPLLALGEPEVTEVNLAEDPKGPKDGWGFKVSVTNNATKPIEYLNMQVAFLDAEGKTRKTSSCTLVAATGNVGCVTREGVDDYYKPMEPGQSRAWYYTTGEVPEGWADTKNVRVTPIAVKPSSPNP